MIRIAVLDDYQRVALEYADWSVLSAWSEVQTFADHVSQEDALVDRLIPFDIVCLMRERTPLDAGILARLPNLKLIVTAGMWNAAVDIAAAQARGVAVCGTSSGLSGTPELTWLLILALARRLPRELHAIGSGGWQTGVGADLEGRTLGLLGLGTIGRRVAKVANAFGMRVLAWSRNLREEDASAAGAQRVDQDDLLKRADFVSIHLKLGARSRNLIGARELGLMKPTAYLINTSRGPIVSEADLIEALRAGAIAGAGLDVFDVEPLPADHPLRSMANVIATPHVGYVTEGTYRRFFAEMVEDIAAWRSGTTMRTLAPRDSD